MEPEEIWKLERIRELAGAMHRSAVTAPGTRYLSNDDLNQMKVWTEEMRNLLHDPALRRLTVQIETQ